MKLKLTGRFFLTHGTLVLFTLGVSFGLLYVGSWILLNRESARSQQQVVETFALTGREAALQFEDVAVLNFMRHTTAQSSVVYTAFSNPRTGTVLAFPQSFQAEALDVPTVSSTAPIERKLRNGTEVRIWTQSVETGGKQRGWVQVAYSKNALREEVGRQVKRWVGLGAAAAMATLLLGWLLAWAAAVAQLSTRLSP